MLPPGAALPAERELVIQTGLSRGSVRDALRILESESLVITRPGRYGGSVANKPDDESLKRSISSFVHGRGITLLSLLQTREAIEPSLAALAAKNRTADELQRLVDVTERVENAFLTPQHRRTTSNEAIRKPQSRLRGRFRLDVARKHRRRRRQRGAGRDPGLGLAEPVETALARRNAKDIEQLRGRRRHKRLA